MMESVVHVCGPTSHLAVLQRAGAGWRQGTGYRPGWLRCTAPHSSAFSVAVLPFVAYEIHWGTQEGVWGRGDKG